MTYDNVMVDLETTGTNPNHAAIIQLSAVKFNLEEQQIDMNMFDQCLGVPPNRYWQEDTRDWWAAQEPHIMEKIWRNMRDPATVIREFAAWCGPTPLVLWAKPIHFEYPFLESYFNDYGVAKPFAYWDAKDLRSICWARGIPNLDREIDFAGDAHNAIHDVLHQISTLFELMNRTGGPGAAVATPRET